MQCLLQICCGLMLSRMDASCFAGMNQPIIKPITAGMIQQRSVQGGMDVTALEIKGILNPAEDRE